MASSRPRGTLSYEPQVQSKGTLSESPHPPVEDRGKASPDNQSTMSSSVASHGLSLPSDNRASAATEPPAQSQSLTAPRRLEKSNSRLIGSEGVHREAKRAIEAPTSDRKERKGATVPDEYETRPEDSATRLDGANRRKAEPNPPTSYTHKQAPIESSAERTYSSNPSRGNDPIPPRPVEMGKSRGKVVQSSDLAPSLGIKETYSTRPPPASAQSPPKQDIGAPSHGNSMGFTPLPSAFTQSQHKHDVEVTRVVSQPLQRDPSVACDSIPTTSFGKSPLFLTAFRLTSDPLILSLLFMTPAIETPSPAPKEGLESQAQPGFLSKTDLSLREDKALAALEGRYPQDPIIGMAPSMSHFSQGVTKPLNSSNVNKAKLNHGGLNRGYSP